MSTLGLVLTDHMPDHKQCVSVCARVCASGGFLKWHCLVRSDSSASQRMNSPLLHTQQHTNTDTPACALHMLYMLHTFVHKLTHNDEKMLVTIQAWETGARKGVFFFLPLHFLMMTGGVMGH